MLSTPSDERGYTVFATQREGCAVSIFTNNSLVDLAPILELPALSCLTIKMTQPDVLGFASSADLDRLSDIDQKVEQFSKGVSVFAGRQTSSGKIALYFYATSEGMLEKPFQTAMAEVPEYEFETRHQTDHSWRTFFEHLLPSRIEHIIDRSTQIRTLLLDEGDDGTTPREIDHFVYFQSKEAVSSFEEKIRPMGFEIATTSKGLFRKTYRMVLSREDVPNEVDRVIIELDNLAQKFDGTHDGWEANVVKK